MSEPSFIREISLTLSPVDIDEIGPDQRFRVRLSTHNLEAIDEKDEAKYDGTVWHALSYVWGSMENPGRIIVESDDEDASD